jgi:hypothetical protein
VITGDEVLYAPLGGGPLKLADIVAYVATQVGGGGNTPAVKTIRNIATRLRHNNQQGATIQSLMSRTVHLNQGSPVTQIAPVWSMWWASANGEFAGPTGATITASVEYPSGTFTQITFGGNVQGAFPSGTANLQADFCPVKIPRGGRFWIRSYVNSTTGNLPYSAGTVTDITGTVSGEACAASTGAGTDQTMSGSITNTPPATGSAFFPTAILGLSNVPSVFVIGDSRCAGTGDNPVLNIGYSGTGEIGRSLDPRLPYMNCGSGSDQVQHINTPLSGSPGSPLRMSLAVYHTHAHSQAGTNDLTAGLLTAAQLMTQYGILWNALASITGAAGAPLKVSQNTVAPVTTSTDAWATVANQGVASSNPQRIAVNSNLRAPTPPAPLWIVLDTAAIVEEPSAPGKWKAPTGSTGITGAMTADGTHETPLAYRLIVDNNAIDTTLFV